MRILVAHNRYRSAAPSGENAVVDAEIALLRGAGMDVQTMLASSDEIVGYGQLAKAATGAIYSHAAMRRFTKIVDEGRPDVVHIHNVYPLISPHIVVAAHSAGLPVVQTVHNYRHTCINGQHFRDGQICDDCVTTRVPWRAIVGGCYRDSRVQSLAMALGQVACRPTWQSVDVFLALTNFMADRLVASGIERARIRLRPSWTADPGTPTTVGQDVLFVGRLDDQKGIRLLLEAWRDLDASVQRQLVVAGDGPLAAEVRTAACHDSRIQMLGKVGATRVAALMRDSAVVAVPSLWYEGFPLVIAEAFANGRGVMVTAGTSAASAVPEECGLHLPSSRETWTAALGALSDNVVEKWGAAARAYYELHLSPEVALASLRDAYRAASSSVRAG
jgi:glycosyltransferase involved in cell wall biosynthesis